MEKLTRIFGAIIPTFFVTDGGVSLSEVNRIQAEHNQTNTAFWTKVQEATAGVFRQVITVVEGSGKASEEIEAARITVAEINLYREVGDRNAQTALFMHSLKLWRKLRAEVEAMDLRLHVVNALPDPPVRPVFPERPEMAALPNAPKEPEMPRCGTVCDTKDFMDLQRIDEMIANLKPEVFVRFDFAFWKRANGLNSLAATLGKLLSEQGAFFRRLVAPLPKAEAEKNQSGVTITSWKRAYTPDEAGELGEKRNELQTEYDDLQKQLNGCRKQIKDAVREHNLTEERRYQSALSDYNVACGAHRTEVEQIQAAHLAALEAHSREVERIRTDYQNALKAHGRFMERIRSDAETLRQELEQELSTLRVRVE